MNADIKTEWLKRLRSGDYQQGRSYLRKYDGAAQRFCCLGVLCDIHDTNAWREPDEDSVLFDYDGDEEFPPEDLLDFVGLSTTDAGTLATMNDGGKTFTEIADYIEATL